MKYKDWLDEWINMYVKITAKSATIDKYHSTVKNHILPKLGEYDIDDLTSMLLQRFIVDITASGNSKTGLGLSSNTVNSVINVLQNSLRIAYNLGLSKTNAATSLQHPKPIEKKVECFSSQEQAMIVRQILNGDKPHLFGIVLCLYTGLRIGELLALTWIDLDFQSGILNVNKSCHYGKDKNGMFGMIVEAPKTQSSYRQIPLPKQLVPIIENYKKQSMGEYVVSKYGKPISNRTYQRNFEALLKFLQIPHKGFHALRHTFATRAIECGMDVKTLSEILGHKNATITLNRYTHSLLDHKKNMMNLVGKLL